VRRKRSANAWEQSCGRLSSSSASALHDPVRQTGNGSSRLGRYYHYYAVRKHRQSQRIPDRLTGTGGIHFAPKSKRRLSWTRMLALADRWLPRPRVLHPYPRLASRQSFHDKNGCANERPSGSARGVTSMRVRGFRLSIRNRQQ